MAYFLNGATHKVVGTTTLGAAPLTLAARLKVTTNTLQCCALGLFDTDNGSASGANPAGFSIAYDGRSTANFAAMTSMTGGFAPASFNATATNGQWYSIVGTFTSNSRRDVYVDVLTNTASSTASTTLPSSVDAISCGAFISASNAIDSNIGCTVAEAAAWNVVLDSNEITAFFAGFSPFLIRPSALVHFCPLVNEAVDRKLSPLTVVGAVAAVHPRVIYA